ncbi:hypothetical protein VB005_01717 [Metarhizium brunneum]
MGGKGNKFKELSGGKATNFAFQYEVRCDNDYKEITLFDNSHDGEHWKSLTPEAFDSVSTNSS